MIYKAKNIANYFWGAMPVLLIIDLLIIGGNFKYGGKEILLTTLIGGGIGILILWAGNKDAGVELTKGAIKLTKTATDSTTINKSDIDSYEVLKEGGKTIITVNLKDRSKVSVSSFALQLNDFESVMKDWMAGVEMKELKEDVNSNSNFDSEKLKGQAFDIAGKATAKFKDIVAGKSESDVLNEKLMSLSELKEKGILNEEEYQKKKTEILNNFS
jgi:hypothetical protein